MAREVIAKELVGCADEIRRWTFPQPEDGGIVLVNYPFVLQAPAGR